VGKFSRGRIARMLTDVTRSSTGLERSAHAGHNKEELGLGFCGPSDFPRTREMQASCRNRIPGPISGPANRRPPCEPGAGKAGT
jgi:hypothetical protein